MPNQSPIFSDGVWFDRESYERYLANSVAQSAPHVSFSSVNSSSGSGCGGYGLDLI